MGIAEGGTGHGLEVTGEFVRSGAGSSGEPGHSSGFIQTLNQRYAAQQLTRAHAAEVKPPPVPGKQLARARLRTKISTAKPVQHPEAPVRTDTSMPVDWQPSSERRPAAEHQQPSPSPEGPRGARIPPTLREEVAPIEAQRHCSAVPVAPVVMTETASTPATGAARNWHIKWHVKWHIVRQPSWIMAGIMIAVAAALVGGGVWWLMLQRLPDIDPRQLIATNLAAAKTALDADHVVDPPERSAVHYYSMVLALDPTNVAAKSAIEKIFNGYIEMAQASLVAGQFGATVIALQGARKVQPDDHRLSLLDAQLREQLEHRMQQSKALMTAGPQAMPQGKSAEVRASQRPAPAQGDSRERAAKALSEAARAIELGQLDVARILIDDAQEFGVAASDLAMLNAGLERAEQARAKSNLLQLVLQRTAENQLLDPAQDSAKYYLDQLAQTDATFPGLQQGVKALGGRLVANAQVATYGKDFDLAARLLTQAQAIGFAGVEVDAAQAALDTARKPPSLADSASVERRLIKFVKPEYPQAGRVRGTEGWVDLSLAVTAAGDVVDSRIEDSNVNQAFGRAALAASRQWKYEPRALAEANTMQPVQVRVTFKLDDGKKRQRAGAEALSMR